MALSLITIGAVLMVVGFRGNATQFYSMIAADVKGGFLYWVLAIVGIGFLGMIPSLKSLSNWLLVLILLVLVLQNKNFIANAESAIGVQS